MQATFKDRCLVTLQHCLPARFMGRIIYRLSRAETLWLKNMLIRGFCQLYAVDTAEAALPVPDGYRSFNDFFTRTLSDGARPADTATDSLLAPADGTIAELGCASNGQLIQAKGMEFSASDLLGDTALAAELADCHFATIYLAPYNYHRLHMPIDGTLEQTLFIPGRLYSVNARTAATVPNLYAVNERLVCQFSGKHGNFAMVLVGAMNVASISTAWSGEIMPPQDRRVLKTRYTGSDRPQLARGDYMGHFNMGSTVVLLGPRNITGWAAELPAGATVRVGQRLATLSGPT